MNLSFAHFLQDKNEADFLRQLLNGTTRIWLGARLDATLLGQIFNAASAFLGDPLDGNQFKLLNGD